VKVLAVVQARVGSSRLPGKVLMDVAGASLLVRMLERVRAARSLDHVVVATSDLPADRPIVELCHANGIPCFAGHPTDLLDRHLGAAREFGGEVVVKIPSDCPLVDPRIIDRVLGVYRSDPDRYDFVSNLHPQSYPDGNDVEVMPLPMLELAYKEATKPHEREHTTPFFWDQPDRFRIGNVRWESDRDLSMSHRFTVDYIEDLDFVRAVFQQLYRPGSVFSLDEILELLEKRPDIFALNARFAGVNWYRHHLDELRTVDGSHTVHIEKQQTRHEGNQA
jgi:spore coat polysaccharide biosynthesis protein SpsF